MEEFKDQQTPEEENFEDHDDYEFSHTDKIVGVFSEPSATFKKMAAFAPKTTDWLIPVLLVIVVAAVSNFIMMSNPIIKASVMKMQTEKIEKNFADMVEAGTITQEQADQQLDQIHDRMESQMGAGMIIQVVSIFIITFIVFFIVAGVFFLIAKYGLKGDGDYKAAMVAYGLPYYIVVIQVIVMVILALAMDKFFSGTGVGAFLDMDNSTFAGFLLNKLDIFSIWFYVVAGIGFAKMFKSEQTGKYIGMTIGMWLGFSITFFFLAQAIPFLRFFIR